MGIYRLLLSILVVFFHTTTLLGTVGYSTVFGFYIISGYCISMVLDKKYRGHLREFWVNRGLKLIPPYLALLACSMILMNIWNVVGDPSVKLFTSALDSYSLKDICNEILFGYFTPRDKVLIFNGFPTIITQAWTNCVEIFFYLTAPLLCLVHEKNKKAYYGLGVLLLVFPIVTAFLKLDFPTYRYRSVFGSYWLFFLGSLLYFKRDSIPKIKNSGKWFALLGVIYILMFGVGANKAALSETKIYISVIIEVMMLIMALQMPYNSKVDKRCAILSVGIYLSHKLARALTLVIISQSQWLQTIFKGGESQLIVVPMLVISVGLAFVLYICVDRPVERIRQRVSQRVLSDGGREER